MPRETASKNDPDTQIVNTKTRLRCAINMRRLVKRRREPHEIPSRTYAIFNQCRECRGWEGDGRSLAEEVAACPNDSCLLWPLRCRNASKSPNIDHQAENRPNLPANNPDIDFGTIGRLERPIIDSAGSTPGVLGSWTQTPMSRRRWKTWNAALKLRVGKGERLVDRAFPAYLSSCFSPRIWPYI